MTQWNDAISWGLQDWASGVRSDGSRHVTHLAACLSLNLKARSRVLGSDKKLGSFTWFTNGLLTGSVFLSVSWQVGFRCKRRCLGILGCIYSPRATNRGSSWSVPDMDGVIWRLGAGLCVQKEEHLGTNHNKSTQIFDSERSGWCERLVGFWQQKVRLWVQFPSVAFVQPYLPISHKAFRQGKVASCQVPLNVFWCQALACTVTWNRFRALKSQRLHCGRFQKVLPSQRC